MALLVAELASRAIGVGGVMARVSALAVVVVTTTTATIAATMCNGVGRGPGVAVQ